ncbi:dimethyl sulfoxide reductase anchor subunit family protein [Leminorella grimontii]|uniref:dimethyl sulfoxide reductase anchor subunit family protein n=1 Tax=Leminorella grimontii TaxID=82981 RepID=UPI002082E32D|nr:DmsC/YnfH family molybdoenzyme membrane anchor subunit [Leminorella grimontii]GKX59802.1 DMSO reductase subunit C [Leminorella grimontii]
MHEWPLVIFTLLMQLAIGCVVTVWYCQTFALSGMDGDKRLAVARPAILCALVIGAIGLLASMTHLGNPMHALYTLSHVASSWMSREILFTALFMALLFLTAVVVLVKKKVPTALLALTALAGVADIFVMSAIYDNSRFILWQGWGTYAGFYGSALMMGSLLGALCMQSPLRRLAEGDDAGLTVSLLRLFIVGILLATLAVIAMLAVATSGLTSSLSVGITSTAAAANVEALTIGRYVLLAVALLLTVNYAVKKRQALPGGLLSLALVVTVVGELLGRYAFFSVGG